MFFRPARRARALAVPPEAGRLPGCGRVVVEEGPDGTPRPRPALTDVEAAAPAPAEGFGRSPDRQLVLAVDDTQRRRLGRVLAAVGSGG
ncbi:MAG: hypothetical protein R2734_07950 [Nocardioides sp.]